jgi:hypothetical protein
MWPWGHLAVGYLAYSALSRYRLETPPRAGGALALALGTQAPDLIDKPLAWTFALLPSGRSLAHSTFVAGLVVLAVVALGRRYRRSGPAAAFGVGYLSHVFADALYPLWVGEYASLAYLVWPLLPVHDAPTPGIIWYVLSMEWTPYATLQFVLVVIAAGVWVVDGTPGLGPVRRAIFRLTPDVE